MKEFIALSLFFLLLVGLFPLSSRSRSYCLLALVFYPLVIQVFGRDAFTISTLLIYVFALPMLFKAMISSRSDSMNLHATALIALAMLSTFQVYGDTEKFLPAVRQLSNFTSAILLYAIIINIRHEDDSKARSYADGLFSLLIYSAVIQCLISLAIVKIPEMKTLFSVFSYGKTATFDAVSMVASFSRLNSLILPFEAMGEFLAFISPIVLYKFFQYKKLRWIIIYIFLFFILCLNQTRSGFLLYIGGGLLYWTMNIARIGMKPFFYVILAGVAASVFAFEYSTTLFSGILARLDQTSKTMDKSGELFKVINREGFYYNMLYLIDSLTPFGHGLISPIYYKVIHFHFHSLWQTITFQFGYLGAPFFFALLFRIYAKAISYWRNTKINKDQLLGSAVLLSMTIFFINESKYEFNRYEGYQQVVWAYLGCIYALCSSALSAKPADERPRW